MQGDRVDRYQRRCGVFLLCGVMVVLLGLGGRLVHIHAVLRDRLLAIAENQRESESVIAARRGLILDARGRVVAATEQMPDVFVDPARVEDVDAVARELSPRVNLPAAKIAERIRARPGSQFVVIESQVDAITAEAVRAMKRPGLGLSERPVRTYPLVESMAHVLGWVGRDGGGLEGIELGFDAHLRGKDGKRSTIRDARRRALRRDDDKLVPPTDGGHVVLTLDAEIQRVTETALAQSVERVEAEDGLAIVMSPQSGEILAMACYPSFDPNDVGAAPPERRRNRAITDPVEPGSTFKPVIVCGALEGSFINTAQLIDCHMGTRSIGSRIITDVSPRGMLDIKGIVTHSSNIGMSLVAERMGNPALYSTIKRFHFGSRTGIDCPGEAAGMVFPLKNWNRMSTASVAMGYEILVTPLQLLTAFAAIINDGVMVKPRVVKALLGPTGEVVRDFQSVQPIGRVVDPQVARYVANELLVSVVEHGSGRGAKLDHYRVMGKTGTAKLLGRESRLYEQGAYQGAFVGAAPVGRPELVVLVMIRRPNPKIAYYGSAVAAPVAGEILGQALPYLGVPADDAEIQVATVGG